MKKISQTNWNRYKSSQEGKEAIETFRKMYTKELPPVEVLNVAKRYDPQYLKALSSKQEEDILRLMLELDRCIDEVYPQEKELETYDDCLVLYNDFIQCFMGKDFENIEQNDYKFWLSIHLPISLMLYINIPGFFLPNFFIMQFAYLKRFAEKYELELPENPKRSDYAGRCNYYLHLCVLFANFAQENGFKDASEFCAFLYDYEMPVIKEELENENIDEMPEYPAQVWLLVGNYGEGEKNMEHGFWQANEFTEKGDLLLFYEKSPVKKLNSIWIAQQDGVVDPFFYYYSNTYIGGRIEIPEDKAVTFEDFKNSEYFAHRDKKGNFVNKNFQDCSGWPVSFEDYKEIKRMLEEKGFDTNILPKLFEPTIIGNVEIKLESDVSEKLLIPLLNQMGWEENRDFKREVEFRAGRGTTGYSMDKRPDFCLHIKEKNEMITTKVVVEVKLFMKNNNEVREAFRQGYSYANWGGAEVLAICDMKQIRVYKKNNQGTFVENKYVKFSWADMEKTDQFNELKRLLAKK